MAFTISDECTACGSCKDICPAEAIAAGDKKYTISADSCIDCGACAGSCPAGAIKEA